MEAIWIWDPTGTVGHVWEQTSEATTTHISNLLVMKRLAIINKLGRLNGFPPQWAASIQPASRKLCKDTKVNDDAKISERLSRSTKRAVDDHDGSNAAQSSSKNQSPTLTRIDHKSDHVDHSKRQEAPPTIRERGDEAYKNPGSVGVS